LHVTRVQVSSGLGGSDGAEGMLEGLVSGVSSKSSFYIGEQLIETDSNTKFVLHGQALAPNLFIRVHGVFAANGALVAKTVIAKNK
jgi:hypothetical protein